MSSTPASRPCAAVGPAASGSDPEERGDGDDLLALGVLLKRAQHRTHVDLDHGFRGLGVNLGQWAVMREIDAQPGASSTELAHRAFQTPQALGALATRLADRGLIERRPNGRELRHYLTETGHELFGRCNETARAIHERFFDGLDLGDRRRLARALRYIAGPAR